MENGASQFQCALYSHGRTMKGNKELVAYHRIILDRSRSSRCPCLRRINIQHNMEKVFNSVDSMMMIMKMRRWFIEQPHIPTDRMVDGVILSSEKSKMRYTLH